MIADILSNISNNTKYVYQLKLRKTNLELITFIPFIAITFTKRFRDYSELSFEVADSIYIAHTHSLAANPVWNLIKPNHVIELNIINSQQLIYAEYYNIQMPVESGGENEHIKTYQCVPMHQSEFNRKKLRGFNDTRKLFDFDLQYYIDSDYTDVRPYAFVNNNSIVEGNYTTYDASLYTNGGVLNYIIEHVLNKDTPIEDSDVEQVSFESEERPSYNQEYYYPTHTASYYQGLVDRGLNTFPALSSYRRLKRDSPKGLLTHNKYWKVSYYDTNLLTIWANNISNITATFSADELYDFFYGDIMIKYTDRSITNESTNDDHTMIPYLANGLMTYWNHYQKSGKGIDGINLADGTFTNGIPNDDWYKIDWENESVTNQGFTFGNWNEGNLSDGHGPTVGRQGFAGGSRIKLENYDTYIPSDYNAMQEIEKQSRLFYDTWTVSAITGQVVNENEQSLLSSWGMEEWNPIYGGNLSTLLLDLRTPDSSKWFYNILTDPLAGAILTQRADACIKQLQNYIDVIMTAASATNILNENNEIQQINSFDTPSFNTTYKALTAFYQRLVYFLWFPLYQKFSSYTGKMPYRSLNITNSNLTEIFKMLEEEFMCRFEFDNIKKEIQIYAYNNEKYNTDSQLVISPYNYITDMSVDKNINQVVTRLYIEGKDGLWVTGVHPSGQRYVDDFSFFMSTDYMSLDLINKLNLYQKLISGYDINKNALNNDYATVNVSYEYLPDTGSAIEKQWVGTYNNFYYRWKQVLKDFGAAYGLYNQFKQLEEEYDNCESVMLSGLTPSDEGYEAATAAKEAAQIGIYNSAATVAHQLEQYVGSLFNLNGYLNWTAYNKKFNNLKNRKEAFENKMNELKQNLTYKNIRYHIIDDIPVVIFPSEPNYNSAIALFSEDNLAELRRFILEDDQTQSAISDETTLYQYAKDYLKLLTYIPIDVNASLIDILSVPTYYNDWSRINDVGKKCRILYPKLGFNLHSNEMLTIVEYTHSYSVETQTLSIKLSNSNDIADLQYRLQINTWISAFKAYKTIDKYRASWDEYINNKDKILWQGQNIRASSNPIVDTLGNKIIDGTGVVLSKANGNRIIKYSDGLYCGAGVKGGSQGYEVIELQDFNTMAATEEGIRKYTANLEEGTLVFVYDKTKPLVPGMILE